ncbi:MAG: hypothetical protein K6E91_07680, partial [Butyrivibrio sp.]|nr:hypothetical protein [Butyrivibrio sp.]
MARMKSISSIEKEISEVTTELEKAQERCDALSAQLLALQNQKQEAESKPVMDAFRKSGKSMEELMT